jgi:predicted exporter
VNRADRVVLAIAGAAFALLLAFVAARLEVSTDVLAFLPAGEQREVAEISREIAGSELTRTIIVTVEADSVDRAVEAGRRFEAALRQSDAADRFAFIEGGPPVGVEEAIWTLYHPRRLAFVASDSGAAAERVSDAGLEAAAAELLRRLSGPMSSLAARVAPSDPLLALPSLFERLEGARGVSLGLHDGRFASPDSGVAVLFLGTHASSFDAEAQRPVLGAIDRSVTEVRSAFGDDVTFEMSGVNRFAVRAEAAIKADIRRVSIVSFVSLSVLLLVLFRSLRILAVAAVPIGTGMIAGAAATLAVYGRIHGVTIAFGASLIGVAVDYIVHLYCHHAVRGGDPRDTARRIWRALLTGAVTTIVGFVALAFSKFPGLREVSLFSVVGVATALLCTRWVAPLLLATAVPASAVRDSVVRFLAGTLRFLRARRVAVGAIIMFGTVAAGVGVSQVRWNESFSDMAQLDPELVAEDDRVRARVMSFEQTRFVVAIGDDDEAALKTNERARDTLLGAVADGEVASFRSVSELLPSAATQRDVASVLVNDPTLMARLERAFSTAGFRAGSFDEFAAALAAGVPEPLTWDTLADSPLAPLVRPHRVHVGERIGYLSFLEGVSEPELLAERFRSLDDVVFVDQGAIMRDANLGYQRSTARALLLGMFAVFVTLLLRYRDIRRAAAAFLPSVVAAAVTVAVLTAAGVAVDLVGLTALLMVVSIGVDYGVFLVDAHDEDAAELSAALLSVFVACLTTVLGFGTLALSSHPVLHAIGLTAAVGVTTSLIVAPAALVVLGRARGSKVAEPT